MIIALSGKGEAGKDYVGKIMKRHIEEIGHKAMIIHYGDYLKFLSKEYFGWDGNKDEKGRTLLQYVGTDLIRSRQPTFWVNAVLNLVVAMEKDYDFFIVPDCRYLNEVEVPMLNGFDVEAIRVIRPNHITSLTNEQQNHISETALDDYEFDFEIINDKNVEFNTIEVLKKIVPKKY
jgi:hypothetical protein